MPTSIPTSQSRIERLVREVPALVAELRLDAVLQRVADLAAEVVGARYVAVGLLAPDRRTLDTFIVSGRSEEERGVIGPLPTGKGILGLLIKEGHPIRLADLGRHPASVGFPANHPPMRSFLGVPVVSPQGVIGELYLTEKIGAAEFSEEDEHIAVLLALTTASAVENARLHTDRSRLLEEVQQLHRSRERFFAMVNHELRNALAAVYGWAEMLVRKKEPGRVPRAAGWSGARSSGLPPRPASAPSSSAPTPRPSRCSAAAMPTASSRSWSTCCATRSGIRRPARP